MRTATVRIAIVAALLSSGSARAEEAWVSTPDYRSSLRDLKEAAKLAVNKLLAAKDEGIAEVSQAQDPQMAQSGGKPA